MNPPSNDFNIAEGLLPEINSSLIRDEMTSNSFEYNAVLIRKLGNISSKLQGIIQQNNFEHLDFSVLDNNNVRASAKLQRRRSKFPMDELRKKMILKSLLKHLLHATHCSGSRRFFSGCNLVHCDMIKDLLQHLDICKVSVGCDFNFCRTSQLLLRHWKNCICDECTLCMPLKSIIYNSNEPTRMNPLPASYILDDDVSYISEYIAKKSD